MFRPGLTLKMALLICLYIPNSPIWAQTCDTESTTASTPTNRFSGTGAVVIDRETQLSWMRCATGQIWDGKQCGGKPSIVDWHQAMALVDEINNQGFDGHRDWRVPMIPELATIVELQCFHPRVNSAVFPNTPSVIFWTSMEKISKREYVYTLDFGIGEAAATLKSEAGAIRLVRGEMSWKPPVITMH